jgi:hypothetical protein
VSRRRCLALAVMTLVAPLLFARAPLDPYLDPYNRFAKAMREWIKGVLAISPFSPDFREVAVANWHELQIGELFRELEQAVMDWRHR